MDKNGEWSERASRLFCIIAYTAIGYAVMAYIVPPMLPLISAFLISFVISSLAGKLSESTGIPRGVWAFLIVSALLGAVCFALFFAIRTLLTEISALLSEMSLGRDILGTVSAYIESVPAFEYAREELQAFIKGALSSLSGALSTMLSSALRGTPRAIVGGFVFLMCVYYMSVDFDSVGRALLRILPRGWREMMQKHKGGVLTVGAKYLRANLILFVMTFFETALGLLIICPQYAIIGAIAVAAVDILPVFGAGAVLIPWSLLSFAAGDTKRGVGLLVLYIIISTVRRIAEPKILGKSMGIHPLAALACMYIGYRFFGVWGMLTAPFLTSLGVNTLKERGS